VCITRSQARTEGRCGHKGTRRGNSRPTTSKGALVGRCGHKGNRGGKVCFLVCKHLFPWAIGLPQASDPWMGATGTTFSPLSFYCIATSTGSLSSFSLASSRVKSKGGNLCFWLCKQPLLLVPPLLPPLLMRTGHKLLAYATSKGCFCSTIAIGQGKSCLHSHKQRVAVQVCHWPVGIVE
jgi:hypothetical protein